MQIAIVGAGAIGGFLAAALARSGANVAVVARGEHRAAIARDGLIVDASDFGSFSVRVDAGDDVRDFLPLDVAILTFKSHQWPALMPQLEAAARTGTAIVTMQNGLPFWFRRDPVLQSVDPDGRIGALFPDCQTIGAVVHVSGRITAPGHVHQSGGTRYVLGALDPAVQTRVDDLAAVMRAAHLQPESTERIRHFVWLKLVNNVGLNPISALYHRSISQMLSDPVTRAQVRALMAEALAVGQALGVVEDVDIDGRIAYAERLSDVQTSMLQDLLAGRPLELDPIVGAVVELGDDLGVPVPQLRDVYQRLASQTATR
ncbi:MAG TPA: 2-dehydropantoate 2-reductase [Candidatus Aquilonibacter sp.]